MEYIFKPLRIEKSSKEQIEVYLTEEKEKAKKDQRIKELEDELAKLKSNG